MSLIAELKRRNVIRMAGLYLVGSWLLVQVSSTIAPMFDSPAWLPRTIVLVLALGFVPMLIFAWVFELTPEEIKRDADVKPEESIAPQTARRMDRLIVAGLVIVIALMVVERVWFARGGEAPTLARPAAADAPVSTPVVTGATSIAVLPFLNLSADPAQEYFSEGITEEILNVLAGIEGFTVTSRTSSFHYKGSNKPLPEIAHELGVNYILEGSARTAGKQVRITAQLIRVNGDEHLWSESYTRDLTDIFAVQEEIARNVSTALKNKLSDHDEARLEKTGTHDVAAYQAYLRGRQFANQRNLKSLQDAASAFKQALVADPNYVDAWAGLAQAYALIPEYSTQVGPVIDTVPQAIDAADHALKLDPASSGALTARAYVHRVFLFDWDGAEADFRAAIASDPRNSVAHMWYGELLLNQRRYAEATIQIDTAITLEPLATIMHFERGLLDYCQGDFESALKDIDESLRLQPGFFIPLQYKILALTHLRRFDEARTVAGDVVDNQRDVMRAFVAAMQDASTADAAVAQIQTHGLDTVAQMPLLLAALGRHDLALTALEREFAHHDPYRGYVYTLREFDPLQDNPRFQALLKQVGLPRPAKVVGAPQP